MLHYCQSCGPDYVGKAMFYKLGLTCQSTSEKLHCPANSKRSDCGAGYFSLANIVNSNVVPNMQPLVSCLDESGGILHALIAHSAKWHKSYKCQREINR